MAKGIVKVPFWGAPDGQPGRRERFNVGDTVDGELGDVAIREGWARPAEKKPPANKAEQPAENKSGVASRADPVLKKKTAKKFGKRIFQR